MASQTSKHVNRTGVGAARPDRPVSVPVAGWVGAAGLLLLLAATIATGALVYQHLADASLPGCGAQSACHTLEAHPMGSAGGMRLGAMAIANGTGVVATVTGKGLSISQDQAVLPTSIIAAGYFGAMLAAWAVWVARGRSGRELSWQRWIGRVGALASVVFVVVIVLSEKYCKYCLVAHAANLTWWGLMEVGMKASTSTGTSGQARANNGDRPRSALTPIATALGVFAVAVMVLGSMDSTKRAAALAKSEAAQRDSQAKMLAQAEKARQEAQSNPGGAGTPAKPEKLPWSDRGFTGRWRLGPEKAVVRIVIWSDFQCHQCRRLEGESMAMQAKYPDKVSLSAKHYPWCADCNKNLNGQTLHANACWAARASEAAASIAWANATKEGRDEWESANEAYWRMHRWLFSQGGSFTDATFPGDLQKLGYDPAEFVKVMTAPARLKPIQDDIDEAQLLGISGTPMVWVNGVELKGWESPRALEKAVEAILKADPPAQDARADQPPLAAEKYVADWRDNPVLAMPAEKVVHAVGAPDAPVQVVVFGDYQEPNTARLDAQLRGWIEKNEKPIRYTWRHFPGDSKCNPQVSKVFFEHGCLTSKAAEAAATLGGEAAYWKMHAWLLSHQAGMTEQAVKTGATAVGLDAEALAGAIQGAPVGLALMEDIQAAAALGVGQIPCVYVNGKLVPRWSREGDNVMERIIDEAAKKPVR